MSTTRLEVGRKLGRKYSVVKVMKKFERKYLWQKVEENNMWEKFEEYFSMFSWKIIDFNLIKRKDQKINSREERTIKQRRSREEEEAMIGG